MDYIEEKTPNGITIKVMLKKWNFIAFEKDGKVIYADESEAKVLHRVPVLVYIGDKFNIVRKGDSELAFFKINKGKVVIPYTLNDNNIRRYLFVESELDIDILPVRIKKINDIYSLVRGKDSGLYPDYVILEGEISDEDCIIIKNRMPGVMIIQIDESGGKAGANDGTEGAAPANEKIKDVFSDKNLNIMSNNPVFLARIHLRDMSLSKVNQLLLDFDISSLEADYMMKFIENMLNNPEDKIEIEQNRAKLESLKDSLQFYIYLVDKSEEGVKKMINSIDDMNKLTSYSTLIAKVRTLFTAKKDLLLLTDYENLLYEKKDQLQTK